MMCKENLEIYDLKVNRMTEALGLDVPKPVFSWKLKSEKKNCRQEKARVLVGRQPGSAETWDSGLLDTDCCVEFPYEGKDLQPETRYYVTVQAWNQDGDRAEASSWFETGLLNPDQAAWDGAQWIGAPEYSVASEKLSVFVLETSLRIQAGTRAGVVFGANDARLLDIRWNELQVEGANDIRFVLDIAKSPAVVEVYRRGYCREDREDVPLYVLEAVDKKTKRNLITKENKRDFHKLTIEVEGNVARTCLDGCEIFAEEKENPIQLNPMAAFDVPTFPRLCEIGYYVGKGSEAEYRGIRVRNLRKPCAEILTLDTEKGKSLKGECLEVRDPSKHALPMLRRDFTVGKGLVRARLYASARGIYECSINGKRLGEEYFAPGASQFDHHLMYQTYDVTGFLQEGKNALGCILASGWWSDSVSFRLYNCNYWGDRPSFLGRLVLTYEDGHRDILVTENKTWQYFGEGPYRYAGFFNGETFDARLAALYENFSKPDFQTEGMKAPEVIALTLMEEREGIFPGAAPWPAVNQCETKLVGNYQAPVREVEIFTAKSMTDPLPGLYIYDLGQEIAGVPRLKLRGKAGQKITIRYGEMLYPELPEYEGLCGQMLQVNLREASNIDTYLCKGEGTETYQPRFTFHGFRYIEISGVEEAPGLDEVQGVLLSSVGEMTGKFTCDHPLLNRFVQNVRYSQYCNFISIPTDCPQRNERMGWMGDTHIFCRTATYQSDVENFYLRNLQAMRDLQTKDGRLPCIAPFGGGFGGQTYESAMLLVVWELYQQYGNREILEEYYDVMDRWMDSIQRAGLPGMPSLSDSAWLGDWLAPVPADDYLIFNAFHYRNAVLMAKIAGLTGCKEGQEKYQQIAKETKKYWNDTFVDRETGRTRNADGSLCDVQGSYSIGLSCGVFDDFVREKAYAHLERTTREGNYTVQSGFFGTGPINPMLSEGGYTEAAQKTITQTAYPSWLYPVTQGATTVWERWNSFTRETGFGGNNAMNSFNHYSLGSVVSWLYENVLGIHRDEENPGYKHFTLRPEMGTFQFAEGGIDTVYGRIESAWKKTEDGYLYRCQVPENTTATLLLGTEARELGSGRYEFRG